MMALESLLSESQTSNLTLAQNEQSFFTPIFLIFFYCLSPSIQIMKLIMSLKKMLKHERLKSLCFYLSKVFCEQAPSDI